MAEASRPRLYFGPEEVAGLRARASSTHRRHSGRLRRWVDEHLDRQPLRIRVRDADAGHPPTVTAAAVTASQAGVLRFGR